MSTFCNLIRCIFLGEKANLENWQKRDIFDMVDHSRWILDAIVTLVLKVCFKQWGVVAVIIGRSFMHWRFNKY